MVYCGSPSKACHACRKRKTRCDAKLPTCSQCSKAGRSCPGYRVQADLIFRDQTENVKRKAKDREFRNVSKSPVRISPPDADDEARPEPEETIEIIQRSARDNFSTVQPTLEQLATNYFVSNYVVTSHKSGGFLDTLDQLYRANACDENLVTSLKAVSFASFAHRTHNANIAAASRYQYMKALQLTNAALRSHNDALKDTTLVCIMILSMYETLTGCNQDSLKNWAEHIRGAATLVELRGPNQFKSSVGRGLFLQTTTGILTSCLQRNISLPDHIIAMSDTFSEHLETPHPGLRVYRAMLDFNQFRAAIRDGMITDPREMLHESVKLDEVLVSMHVNHLPEFKFDICYTNEADPSVVYNGCYHVYADLWSANFYNAIRVIRSLLHETVREILLNGFAAKPPIFSRPEHTAQYQRSTDISYEMQAEILASVPQHLGYVKQTISVHDENTKTYAIIDDPTARAFSGYFLLWPLWVAGISDLATEETQAYCARNLRRIGENMGIYQAFLLADAVDKHMEIEVWSQDANGEFRSCK